MSINYQSVQVSTYGGSWYDNWRFLRSANHFDDDPASHYNDVGFRIALRRVV